ncbi:MAG: endonuclease/exonuclease/phosphatase family protein [Gaiellaceae bacterium]
MSAPSLELPAKQGALRVATLNLWGWFADWPQRRRLLSEQLPSLEIDVYLLQEVVCGHERGDQLSARPRTRAHLAHALRTRTRASASNPHRLDRARSRTHRRRGLQRAQLPRLRPRLQLADHGPAQPRRSRLLPDHARPHPSSHESGVPLTVRTSLKADRVRTSERDRPGRLRHDVASFRGVGERGAAHIEG